ncbi:hypothetical protein BKA80DRAFT_95265 [Phyllosticta citrichinensis]
MFERFLADSLMIFDVGIFFLLLLLSVWRWLGGMAVQRVRPKRLIKCWRFRLVTPDLTKPETPRSRFSMFVVVWLRKFGRGRYSSPFRAPRAAFTSASVLAWRGHVVGAPSPRKLPNLG